MKLLFAALFTFLFIIGWTQEAELVSSSPGVFIYVVGNVSPADRILVEKKIGSNFRKLGEIGREKDPQRFLENYKSYEPLWDGYTIFSESKLLGRWRLLDSLPVITGAIDQMEPTVTLAFGITLLDQDVSTGETIVYRFTFPGGERLERSITYAPEPFELQLVNSAYDNWEAVLQIEWKCPFSRTLAGYEVFRSRRGMNDFKKIKVRGGFAIRNNTVFFNAYDTSLHVDGFFDYYIKLLDTRGRISYPSEVYEVHTINRQKRPILLEADIVTMPDQKALQLSWRYSDSLMLKQIRIYRSLYLDRAFEHIASLPPTDTTYIDPVDRAMVSYYYIMIPVDYVGEGIKSPVFTGICKYKEKPLAPSSVNARGMNGGVKITWSPNGSNNRGFKVYRMKPGDSMTLISGFLSNDSTYTFVDTMINKGKVETFGYAVKSESDGYLLSEFSDTSYARAILPLEIAPPNELGSRMDEAGGITLFWDDDMMYDPHIGGYNVYRKAIDESDWTKINEEVLSKGTNFLWDDPNPQGLIYYYDVRVVDVFNIEHPGGIPHMVKFWEDANLRGPKYLKGTKSESAITLHWANLQNKTIRSIRVYRATDGNRFEEIAEVEKDEQGFTDQNIIPDTNYQYYVTAVFDLLESSPSEKLLISLP